MTSSNMCETKTNWRQIIFQSRIDYQPAKMNHTLSSYRHQKLEEERRGNVVRNMAAREVAPGQNGDRGKVHKKKQDFRSISAIRISR